MNSRLNSQSLLRKKSIEILTLLSIVSFAFYGVACAPAFATRFASEQKMILPQEPTETLSPTTVDPSPADDPVYNVYRVNSAKISTDSAKREVSARIQVTSTQGSETVDLLGKIRDDDSASLIDIQPLSGNRYRLAAEAYCQDGPACQQVILNVYFKVGTRTLEKQFVSNAFSKMMAQDSNSPKAATPKSVDTRPAFVNSSPHASQSVPAQVSPPTTSPLPSAPRAAPSSSPTATADTDGVVDPDADDGMAPLEDGGEYVGAQPPQTVLEQLWDRPEIPTAPPAPPGTSVATPSPTSSPSSNAISNPNSNKPAAGAPSKDSFGDSSSDAGPTDHENSGTNIQDNSIPPIQGDKAVSQKATVTPSAPTTPTTSASAKPASPKSYIPANTSPAVKPKPSVSHARPNSKLKSDANTAPAAVVAEAQDIPKGDMTDSAEKRLAPLMDLVSGGKAIGSANVGRLQASEALASDALIHILYPQKAHNFGTGMMVSLIQNATEELNRFYPGQNVLIGDIAKFGGGSMGPGSHLSHQNGQDIDIPYIGTAGFVTQVSGAHVKDTLQYAKTWQFLRLVHSQSIVLNGQEQTAMNTMFMLAPIKAGFCAWAKDNDLLKNPVDADILRRIVPWRKHDNHFHLRLKCSPHYPACKNLPDPKPGTGC